VLEGELGRGRVVEVGVVHAERVELGNVVAADLERADEELDLRGRGEARRCGEVRVS